MGKNSRLFCAFEDVVFSKRLYDSPVEFRLPNKGEEIVVRNWGNVFRGGRGIVVAVFPRDSIFVVDIEGVVAKYTKDIASQRYWKCIEVNSCEQSMAACVAVRRGEGEFIMLYSS
jgi:hypothetical protein